MACIGVSACGVQGGHLEEAAAKSGRRAAERAEHDRDRSTTTTGRPSHPATGTRDAEIDDGSLDVEDPYADDTSRAEAAAKQAYVRVERAHYERLRHPDPDDPTLARDYTGHGLRSARTDLQLLADAGFVEQFAPGHPPRIRVISAGGTDSSVVVIACVIADGIAVNTATGQRTPIPESRRTLALVDQIDGRWKVESDGDVKVWEDTKGCRDDAAS